MAAQSPIFEGRTKEEAVSKGLRELRLERSDVYIEVVEEGAGGFLGIGSRPYRVRLIPRVRRAERVDRGERRDRGERWERGERRERGPRGEGMRREIAGGEARRGGPGRPQQRRGERPRGDQRWEQRGEPRGEARGEQGPPRPERPARPGAAAEGEGGGRRRRRGRRGGRRHRGAEGVAAASGAPALLEAQPPQAERAARVAPEGPPDPALAEEARRLASDLFRHMGVDATVAADAAGDSVNLRVQVGDDEELLTGKKGEVRQALQQLLNRMLNKGEAPRYHLHLEINDFWQRRERELTDLARQLAEEAVETGGEVVTEYLNAQERRVVHVALREDTRVKTYAIGDGLIKKVAIAPAQLAEEQKPD